MIFWNLSIRSLQQNPLAYENYSNIVNKTSAGLFPGSLKTYLNEPT